MALAVAEVIVGNTAVALTGAGGASGRMVMIKAAAGAQVYIGDAAVTPQTGFPLPAGQLVTIPSCPDQVFGIAAQDPSASTAKVGVRVLETTPVA